MTHPNPGGLGDYLSWRKTTASASFLSVDSRCLTEKINPLLRTRPQQNTGIHDECGTVCFPLEFVCKLRITNPQLLTVQWQAKTTASELQLIRVLLFEKIHPRPLTCTQARMRHDELHCLLPIGMAKEVYYLS